jgi:hypothetical protein
MENIQNAILKNMGQNERKNLLIAVRVFVKKRFHFACSIGTFMTKSISGIPSILKKNLPVDGFQI